MIFIIQHTQKEKIEMYRFILTIRKYFKNTSFTFNQYLQKIENKNRGTMFKEMEHNHLIKRTNQHFPARYKLNLEPEDYIFIKKEIALDNLLRG